MAPTNLPHIEIALIDESYARLEPHLAALTTAFWTCTTSTEPTLHEALRGDPKQREVALSLFDFVATNLGSPEVLRELLERMGKRGLLEHVTSEHLDAIGRSLLRTLRDFEGARWTVDTAHAWALAFTWAVHVVRRGDQDRRSGARGMPPAW
jgi:hemoglobin-like flavoprotein